MPLVNQVKPWGGLVNFSNNFCKRMGWDSNNNVMGCINALFKICLWCQGLQENEYPVNNVDLIFFQS